MSFHTLHHDFNVVIGSKPSARVLIEKDYAFAHEAAVFDPRSNALYITSNRIVSGDGSQRVDISKVSFPNGWEACTCDILDSGSIVMGNGGTNWDDDILFCDQGSFKAPSALHLMSTKAAHATRRILTGFRGRPFNSVNDVVVHSDGSIWFTDPAYGYEQGYRSSPSLPSQVYRYDHRSEIIRAVADGFGHPNGLCFSPDEGILYVTDTDQVNGNGDIDLGRPATIYAFDIVAYSGQSFLTNRRLFAICDNGIPDGIKCDTSGNVYSGCGDGIHVWSPGGVLIGKIVIDGGIAHFCFGRSGAMFACNETRLWLIQLAPETRGTLVA